MNCIVFLIISMAAFVDGHFSGGPIYSNIFNQRDTGIRSILESRLLLLENNSLTEPENSSNIVPFKLPFWLQIIFSLLMIFMPVVGYIPQYLRIDRIGRNDGFSTLTCFILLISNILRIFFWVGEAFDWALLCQSALMVLSQLILLEVCVYVTRFQESYANTGFQISDAIPLDESEISNSKYELFETPLANIVKELDINSSSVDITDQVSTSDVACELNEKDATSENLKEKALLSTATIPSARPCSSDGIFNSSNLAVPLVTMSHSFFDFELHYFWRWDNFSDYAIFLAIFSVCVAISSFVFLVIMDSSLYTNILGYAALMIESCLGFPQLVKNCRQSSTKGLSIVLILVWLLGDLFKTVYFLFTHAPLQFVICGFVQLSVDILIIVQMVFYRVFRKI